MKKYNKNSGLTLIEVMVSCAIFLVMALIVAQIYNLIITQTRNNREQTAVSFLADQYMEIARNLPYASIGTKNGNPHGNLADLPEPISTNFNGTDYKIYYAVSFVDDSADGTVVAGTDIAPNDYKQLKLYVKNVITGKVNYFSTNIAPVGLEGMYSGGALYISVIDAVGQPVSGATINIVNSSISPDINVTRISDANGKWVEVGLPQSANGYHITVTKSGFSSNQTYPISSENPNPLKPDSTVNNGQLTQVSFAIDYLSNLKIYTLDRTCNNLSDISLKLSGFKLIGTPSLLKFDNSYTSNSSGQINLNDIEWDVYTPTITTANKMIYGSSPLKQVNLLPKTDQGMTLILGPTTANSLLVVVKDSETENLLQGANVSITKSSVTKSGQTGGSILSQQDWSSGQGQADFVDQKKYFQDSGTVTTDILPLGVRLLKIGEYYVDSGDLISSTFDTGTGNTTYSTLTWEPTSQDADTNIKFQVAANNDKLTWDFVGPDGTSSTFYTTSGSTITHQDNKRYIRYKVFLSTDNNQKTPVLSSVNISYVSGCFTPGQIMFAGIDSGSYEISVSMTGYQTETRTLNVEGNKTEEVLLSK